MTTVYIKLYEDLNSDLSLPRSLADEYKVECLKHSTPDDGEAMAQPAKYRIECAGDDWKDILDILRDSGKSLVYSVLTDTSNGGFAVCEAGEMNSTVRHYTTRLGDAKQLFAFWFAADVPSQPMPLAA